MTATRTKLAALLLTTALLTTGAGVRLLVPASATPADPPPAPAAKAPAPPDEASEVTFRGRVLDSDGKPFAGARVYLFVRRHATGMPPFKDPQAKLETATINGAEQPVGISHPKLNALKAKYGFARPDPNKIDPVRDREMIDEFMSVYAEIFGDDPLYTGPVRARSGADGQFEFRVPRKYFQEPLAKDIGLVAWAAGYGPTWFLPAEGETFTSVQLRLPADIPIQGRLIDIQGRPVAGATVKLGPMRPLDQWFALVEAAARRDTQKYNELLHRQNYLGHVNAFFFPRSTTTDKDGRFRINGIGAERAVQLEVRSDAAGHDEFTVMTRPGPGPTVATGPGTGFPNHLRTYGATFDYVLNPTRLIQGTVRDNATGKPLAGVQVAAWGPAYADTHTDRDGKYQLKGLSKAKEYFVSAWPRGEAAYMVTSKTVDDTFGVEALTVDFEMVRGVWMRGKVTDAATGRPVANAQLRYGAARDNPHLAVFAFLGNPAFRDNPRMRGVPLLQQAHGTTGADGSFQIAVLPGKGVLGVTVHDGPYPPAQWTGPKAPGHPTTYVPHFSGWEELDSIQALDVPEQDPPVPLNFTLSTGRNVAGTVADPDGKPLSGVVVHGLKAREFRPAEPLKTAAFTVTGLSPGQPRLLIAEHAGRKLGGLLRVEGDAAGPLTMKLEPTGSVTGRLLDAKTQTALARKRIMTLFADPKLDAARGTRVPATTATDGQGRFRLDGLVAGVAYKVYMEESAILSTAATVTVRPGEEKDLGDVSVKKTVLEP